MMTNEVFPEIDLSDVKKEYKTNVYIAPRKEMKMNVGRDLHITHATETRSLFEPSCTSWDRVEGYRRETKEKVSCDECPYAKGISQGPDLPPIRCQMKYAIFMEHEDVSKQYVLSVSVPVYKVFQEYRKSLLKMDLDVNQVVTKITRVEPEKGNGYAYEFEFVRELNLEMTDDEEELLNGIKARIASDGEAMSVNDVASLIEILGEEAGMEMSKSRARRLAESIANNGLVNV